MRSTFQAPLFHFRSQPYALARLLVLLFIAIQMPVKFASAESGPNVVASIAPVHSLVSSVMAGVGSPDLLLPGTVSPHAYHLKPSDAKMLEQADVVFWIGPALETVLAKPIETIAVRSVSVQLMDARAMKILSRREGGVFGHGSEEDHNEGDADPHIWLNPANAIVMLFVISETLSEIDPEHAGTYRTNAIAAIERIKALDMRIDQNLNDVRTLPYVAFHDAYQYFEERFGLTPLAVVSIDPDHTPGARRIGEIREAVQRSGATCVFAEPQFSPGLLSAILEGTGARQGELDPLGAGLEPGPFFYEELMEGMAEDMVSCFVNE